MKMFEPFLSIMHSCLMAEESEDLNEIKLLKNDVVLFSGCLH